MKVHEIKKTWKIGRGRKKQLAPRFQRRAWATMQVHHETFMHIREQIGRKNEHQYQHRAFSEYLAMGWDGDELGLARTGTQQD